MLNMGYVAHACLLMARCKMSMSLTLYGSVLEEYTSLKKHILLIYSIHVFVASI